MDWNVKPLSRKSSISGKTFEPGSRVVCFVYKEESGELARDDILENEIEGFEVPQNLLARWIRVVKEHEEDEGKEAQKQTIHNAEELFLSLYEHEETQELLLKQLLALMLERKRILRRLKTSNKDVLTYLHVKTKKEYTVLNKAFSIEAISDIQKQLEKIIL